MYDYTKEKEALREFLAGTRTAAEIKGVFSPYGIYQQKNGLFMMRLRINGGRVSRENLQKVIEIAKCSKARFLHLTTREALISVSNSVFRSAEAAATRSAIF